MIFTDTITVYNHYTIDGMDVWKRTVHVGCQWSDKVIKSIGNDGKLSVVQEVSITIPERPGYVDPKEFDGWGFTFGTGNLDIVMLGECDKEITEEYTITQLRKERPDTATIYAVKDNTLRKHLKHWKVSAK